MISELYPSSGSTAQICNRDPQTILPPSCMSSSIDPRYYTLGELFDEPDAKASGILRCLVLQAADTDKDLTRIATGGWFSTGVNHDALLLPS